MRKLFSANFSAQIYTTFTQSVNILSFLHGDVLCAAQIKALATIPWVEMMVYAPSRSGFHNKVVVVSSYFCWYCCLQLHFCVYAFCSIFSFSVIFSPLSSDDSAVLYSFRISLTYVLCITALVCTDMRCSNRYKLNVVE